MHNAKNILFSFLAFVLTTSVAVAQVQGNQSRLNIGKDAKPAKISNTPISSFVRNTVPSEVSVNNNSAITEFYKDLLLKPSNKVVVADVRTDYEPKLPSKDYLYVTENLSISNIYPNPANDFATLDYSLSSNKEVKVAFYNILGGRVADYELDSFDNQLRVQTRKWDNGIYLYQLMLDGKKVATKKLLVRHN